MKGLTVTHRTSVNLSSWFKKVIKVNTNDSKENEVFHKVL